MYRTFSERAIGTIIHDLATAGVIQKERDAAGYEKIDVHDLYADLAWKEASGSRRFLMWIGEERKVWPRNPGETTVGPRFVTGTEEDMERTKWEELERAIIVGREGCLFIDEKLQHCPKLQFLYARDIKLESRILVAPVSDLRVLIVSWESGSQGEEAPWEMNMNGLTQLEVLELRRCRSVYGFKGLDGLHNLRILRIRMCRNLKNVDGLSRLRQLEELQISGCRVLTTKSLDLGGMTGLKRLWLRGWFSLRELRGGGQAIEDVFVSKSPFLKRIQDCSAVKTLKLYEMKSLQEVGSLNPALRRLSIEHCETLKKLPNLGAVTGLQMLKLHHLPSLQDVGCLSSISALPYLSILKCPGLRRENVLEVRGATGWDLLEDVSDLEDLDMEHIRIEGCAIRDLDVSECRGSLRRLEVIGCEELRTIHVFHRLNVLEELVLEECGLLQRLQNGNEEAYTLADLRGKVKRLRISGCPLLEGFPGDCSYS